METKLIITTVVPQFYQPRGTSAALRRAAPHSSRPHTERWFTHCLESQVLPSLSFLLEGEGMEEEECGRQEGSEN